MPIRTNAYQFYKRCILIAQHNGQRDTPFSFYLSPSRSNIFPRRNNGNSIYTNQILIECLRIKDPQYMTTFLIPNRGKYWLRGDCLIHGQSPLSLFLSILDNRFLIYILSFLRLSCRTIVIQNQPQEFFSRLTLCTTFFCRDMVTMALYRYQDFSSAVE